MAARRASVKIINFLERQIGVDLDGDGDVGIENRPEENTFHYQAEEEEEEEEVLESEKEAAQRAFNLMMQRTGGVLESSSESSEEEEAPVEPIERSIADSGILRIHSPKTIRDHYTLLELLHEGSGRRVYFCEDFHERRPCIVKLWYKAAFAKRELDAVIENQLKLMRLPHHPNIVHPQHLLEDEVCHYAEFDVVFAGSSLFQVIVSDASTTEQWIKRVFRGLCRGLAHLHANGFIHGDIKPENVLLQWQDYQELLSKHAKHPQAWVSVKRSVLRWKCPTQFKTAWTRHQLVAQARIIDLDTASEGSSKPKICGTPGYMAPEEYVGASTQAGDLFAVGVMLFQMIGCTCPFHDAVYQVLRGRLLDQVDEATRREIAKRVVRAVERIDWTESPWRALPKARDLCQQLLSVDPEERGGDAAQVMMASPWLNPRVRKRLRQLVRKKTSEASGSRSRGS